MLYFRCITHLSRFTWFLYPYYSVLLRWWCGVYKVRVGKIKSMHTGLLVRVISTQHMQTHNRKSSLYSTPLHCLQSTENANGCAGSHVLPQLDASFTLIGHETTIDWSLSWVVSLNYGWRLNITGDPCPLDSETIILAKVLFPASAFSNSWKSDPFCGEL